MPVIHDDTAINGPLPTIEKSEPDYNAIGSLNPITKTDWYHYLLLQEQRKTNTLLQQLLDIRVKQVAHDAPTQTLRTKAKT